MHWWFKIAQTQKRKKYALIISKLIIIACGFRANAYFCVLKLIKALYWHVLDSALSIKIKIFLLRLSFVVHVSRSIDCLLLSSLIFFFVASNFQMLICWGFSYLKPWRWHFSSIFIVKFKWQTIWKALEIQNDIYQRWKEKKQIEK